LSYLRSQFHTSATAPTLVRSRSPFPCSLCDIFRLLHYLRNFLSVFYNVSEEVVRPEQLYASRIAAWANQAGPFNTLYFAVITVGLAPSRCDLKSVSHATSSFILSTSSLKITINSELDYLGGHKEYAVFFFGAAYTHDPQL
jgi:hypothetical protein